MLKSSKSVARKRGDGTEDTEGREARGATGGEKPSKGRKPMDGTGTKQGREAAAEKSVEGVRNSEDAAKSGREPRRPIVRRPAEQTATADASPRAGGAAGCPDDVG